MCVLLYLALFGLRVKHICWEHFNFKNNNGVVFRDYGRKIAAKYCDYVVTLTQRDKELWKRTKKINAKIVAIANPGLLRRYREYSKFRVIKQFLTVGQLTHVKGFDLLLLLLGQKLLIKFLTGKSLLWGRVKMR